LRLDAGGDKEAGHHVAAGDRSDQLDGSGGAIFRHLTDTLSRHFYVADLGDGESSLTMSLVRSAGGDRSSVLGPGVIGSVAILGAVAAGVAIFEVALIPGLLIGGTAVLMPRLLPRGMLRRVKAPHIVSAPSAPAHSAQAAIPDERASFDTWRAVVKTFTYRVIVTTVDFGANYFVLGELAAAASLSGLSLVAGPIAYFAHEAIWHRYGPASVRQGVHLPIPGVTAGDKNGQARFANIEVSRAFAKTVTYEVVTGVSEFGANYFFVRDLAAAAGLTAFSMVLAPFVYYLHEKGWDYYEADEAGSPSYSGSTPVATKKRDTILQPAIVPISSTTC
jgi:uncharacterized membrane protein